MKKLLLICILLVASSTIFASISYAQSASGLNITVSPTILDLTADPGTKLQESFRLRNNNDTPVKLHIALDKLNPNSANGEVLPIAAKPGDDTLSWLQFQSTEVTATSREWTTVTFTIDIPKTAAFGYYYAIRIGQEPSGTTNEKVLGEVILPVLLDVRKDGAKAQMTLNNFSTPSYVNEILPITFNTILSNIGNVHLKPHGNIFITDMSGATVGILDVNRTLGNVLPGGKRLFTTNWDDGFLVEEPVMKDNMVVLDKNNKPVTHLVINWNNLTHFRIGKYTAHELLVYDNGKKDVTLEATTSFWIIPWKFLLGAMIGLIVFIVIVRFVLKWYITQEVKKRLNN